jgi:hypothetical protein
LQDELLVAYQIAFDLVHNASQQFRGEVRKAIGSGVEADAEQARIQEYYNEMVKKKEEKGSSPSSGTDSDPMQEEKGDAKPVRLLTLILNHSVVDFVLTLFCDYCRPPLVSTT